MGSKGKEEAGMIDKEKTQRWERVHLQPAGSSPDSAHQDGKGFGSLKKKKKKKKRGK